MGCYLAFAVSRKEIGKSHLWTILINLTCSISVNARDYSVIRGKIFSNRRKSMSNELYGYRRFHHLVKLIMKSSKKS